ncbi:MAG: hypothetical protein HZC38_02515 [Chloroflexi bacterium]|nr:hypothetical protein [Chloroflexota bacterium]
MEKLITLLQSIVEEVFFGFWFKLLFLNFIGALFFWVDFPLVKNFFDLTVEFFVMIPGAEALCLRSLDRSRLSEASTYYYRLNRLGFYLIPHLTARTVFRKGKFVNVIDAPDGHRWQRISPRHRDELGPDFSLSPSFTVPIYEKLPTTLGVSLPEKLRGAGGVIPLAGRGRPVDIGMKLVLGYFFKPQEGIASGGPRGAIENAINKSVQERSKTVGILCHPALEKITGVLNPLDIRLRLADTIIIERLKHEMVDSLKRLGYQLFAVEIETVVLPETLETIFIANQEMLRQSIEGYSRDDLAKMITTQLGFGLRTGASSLTTGNFDPLIDQSVRLDNQPPPPPTLNNPPPPQPPPSPSPPPPKKKGWKS